MCDAGRVIYCSVTFLDPANALPARRAAGVSLALLIWTCCAALMPRAAASWSCRSFARYFARPSPPALLKKLYPVDKPRVRKLGAPKALASAAASDAVPVPDGAAAPR